MAREDISRWVTEHEGVFDRLKQVQAPVTELAGSLAHRLTAGETPASMAAEFEILATAARTLRTVVEEVRAFPPVPDPDTARHFSAGLARWGAAGREIEEACAELDGRKAHTGARALDAGSDEFFRAAAALRKATGQPPL